MRRLPMILVAGLLLFCQTSLANVVEVEFRGLVTNTSIQEVDGQPITIGQIARLWFGYSTDDWYDVDKSEANVAYYKFGPASFPTRVRLELDGGPIFSTDPHAEFFEIAVSNNFSLLGGEFDAIAAYNQPSILTNGVPTDGEFEFLLVDYDATAWDSTNLPSSAAGFFGDAFDGAAAYVTLGSHQIEVSLNPSAIPEPSTIVLFGIAACGVGIGACCRQWRRRNLADRSQTHS